MHNPISLHLDLIECVLPEELTSMMAITNNLIPPSGYENMTKATFLLKKIGEPTAVGLNFVTRIPPRLFCWHLVNPRPEASEAMLDHVRSANNGNVHHRR